MYLVTAQEMREMDRLTIESFGLPGRLLMETAGRGAAEFFLESFPDYQKKPVGIVAGRGNNGGDGFVMARCLAERDMRVTVFLLANIADVTGDAADNLKLLGPLGIPVVELPDAETFSKHTANLRHQGIWIDAILGTGLNAEVKTYFKKIITFINESDKPVFCVDIPSGLHADTGRPLGLCIRGEATATFGFPKIGHVSHPGVAYTGRLKVVDIGIPAFISRQIGPKQHLITPEIAKQGLVERSPDAHKGSTGHLLIAGGSPGKTGAAAMAAAAALRAGAGLVTVGVGETIGSAMETLSMEAMTCPLPDDGTGFLGTAAWKKLTEQLSGKKCVALGPGLGTAQGTKNLLARLLPNISVPLVLDADALNCLSHRPELLKTVALPAVLTPHPGEMARLAQTDTQTVQQDRVACAREFAITFGCHVVLKGAGTVIAHPDGEVYINPTGNAGMAAGGMGDVLTGLIAGFITQGASPQAACRTGVYLHGAVADSLAEEKGPVGFLASEIMHAVPQGIQKLIASTPSDSFQRDMAL